MQKANFENPIRDFKKKDDRLNSLAKSFPGLQYPFMGCFFFNLPDYVETSLNPLGYLNEAKFSSGIFGLSDFSLAGATCKEDSV